MSFTLSAVAIARARRVTNLVIVIRVHSVSVQVSNQVSSHSFHNRRVIFDEFPYVFARGLRADAVFIRVAVEKCDVGNQIGLLSARRIFRDMPFGKKW